MDRLRPFCCSIIIALCTAGFLASQDIVEVESQREPTWLLMERGKLAFENREYGEALLLFRDVKSRDSTAPEVDIAIGEVFEAEGELAIALIQYLRALERSNLMAVPDDEISLIYRIAGLYERERNLLAFEEYLQLVVERVSELESIEHLEEPVVRVLVRDGIDEVVKLYRFGDRGAQQAYYRLGRFYIYDSGRFIEATRMIAVSVVMTLTEIANYSLERDHTYRFDSVDQLLDDTKRFKSVADYVEDSDLYEQLYALGHALNASGRIGPAEDIRAYLEMLDPAGSAGRRASRGYPTL